MPDTRYKVVADKVLFFSVLFLSLFGLVMQYSAGSYGAMLETGDSFFYVKKQAVALAVAIAVYLVMTMLDTRHYFRFRFIILGIAVILLALVFIPGVGVENYGATRWINLGFTTFQPSDYAKFALVIFIAACFSRKSAVTFGNMIPVLLAALIICVLIMLEPNMSITMCVAFVVIIMLFVGGAKLKHFALMAVPAVVVVIALIALEPYRLKRIVAFLDPWSSPLGEGYQLIQSYYALGAGGLFGVGLFNSRQKYLFLPFAESDFIFSVIGEELGWFGCLIIMLIYAIIIWRGILIALRASSRFDSYLAAGITSIIAVQTLLNIAVVTGSIPPTGLPLPFISAGGTSLVMFMSGVGILERIAAKSHKSVAHHKMY